MEWTPVEIGISSKLTEPFAGSVNISAPQDGLNTLNITHTFVLTPDVPLHVPLVTKIAFAADKCSVRIANERGRSQWHHDFDLWDFSPTNPLLNPIKKTDLLMGLIGRRGFGLLSLPRESACETQHGAGRVYVKDKLPRMVPWDWTGFVSLDVLILYDPDWDAFNQNQLQAIAQWVSNGGRLMLILGSHPLLADNPIADFIPFEVTSAKQTTITTDTLTRWGLNPAKAESVVCWPLRPKPNARFHQTDAAGNEPGLFATGHVGFGRVGVLAFDPATMTDFQKTHTAQFWVNRITAVLDDSDITSAANPQDPIDDSRKGRRRSRSAYGQMGLQRRIVFAAEDADQSYDDQNIYHYEISQARAASNALMEYMYDIAELKPLSIWWVIILLAALAILLGPVDYKVLKRIDRLPLTWVTCAFWIVLFSVGAYYGIHALRAGRMQVRAVSVIDSIENSDCIWSTEYSGLFAPTSDDYKLAGLNDQQWWSGIAPVQQYISRHDRSTGSRNLYCVQHDGSNLPYSLPINIWTMQCLVNESPLSQLPIDANVERNGNEDTMQLRLGTALSSPPAAKVFIPLPTAMRPT